MPAAIRDRCEPVHTERFFSRLRRRIYHSWRLARRALSARAANFAQTTEGWVSSVVAELAKPQSAPAIKFSRPTAMFHNTALRFYRLW
jgi:hypothetical protein